MRSRKIRQVAMTLIELVAALTIAAAVAAISIQHLRPAGETAKQRGCDMTRQLLQNEVRRYQETTGRRVSGRLSELETDEYAGTKLPVCPVTGEAYRRDRAGTVHCPTHESTRVK